MGKFLGQHLDQPLAHAVKLVGIDFGGQRKSAALRSQGGAKLSARTAGRALQQLLEDFHAGLGRRPRQPGKPGILLQEIGNVVDQDGVEQPLAREPPPPRPPAAAAGEGHRECAAGVGRGAANLLLRTPPPPPIDVISAHRGAHHGLAIRADHAAGNGEFAAPAPPPPPVMRGDQDGRKLYRIALPPSRGRNIDADGLQAPELFVAGGRWAEGNLKCAGVLGER